MKKYDIKPDHHIRAKRASLTGLTIGLLLLFQAVRGALALPLRTRAGEMPWQG